VLRLRLPSIAEGAGLSAVQPITLTYGGSVGLSISSKGWSSIRCSSKTDTDIHTKIFGFFKDGSCMLRCSDMVMPEEGMKLSLVGEGVRGKTGVVVHSRAEHLVRFAMQLQSAEEQDG
jgi:hypothetical protein